MTTLINKVINILNSMDDVKTVMFDNNYSANIRIDRAPLPGALLYTLPNWKIDLNGGVYTESADIEVFFFDSCKFDGAGETKIEIIQQMENIARDFLKLLLEDKDIKVINNTINVKGSYGSFDKFVCGTSLEITIEQKQGECL